jgi:hypothetical protein
MSAYSRIPPLERPSFFPGERLAASDLDAVQRYHRTLRWLHNRAMHDWGVALGLAVSGERGEKTVRVTPGLAVDRAGREVLLAEPTTLQVPALAGTAAGEPVDLYLTASYLDDDALTPETRGGECGAAGAVRYAERCALRFQRPASFAGTDWVSGVDLVLASIKVRDCKLAAAVAAGDRREIAPPSPHVAAGSTTPGDTPWELWTNFAGVVVGVRTRVSTAHAGFIDVPRYQARVGGRTLHGSGSTAIRVDGYVQIEDATANAFTCGVLLPQGSTGSEPLNPTGMVLTSSFMATLSTVLEWHVVWMGVEG